MRKYLKNTVALICFTFTGALTGQTFQETLASIQDDHGIVGMAVKVSCGSEEIGSYLGGLRNIDTQLPLTEETVFRVASISKSFSAAALLKALESSEFELDDDISDLLEYEVRNPGFPDVPISVRMVLSHTSSLQDGSGYSPFLSATYNSAEIPNMSEVLLPEGTYYTPNMWRTEEPGTFFAYSNMNYGLVGTLIEKLTDQRFDVYTKEAILEPLGIQGSFYINDLENINNVSVLYRNGTAQWDDYNGNYPPPFEDDYEPGTNGSRFAPQGGLRCTIGDLITFGEMLLNQGMHDGIEILSSEIVDEMLSEQWAYDGSNGDDYFGLFQNWGLGVHRSMGSVGFDKVFENLVTIGHPGEAYGLISDLYINLENELVLAFISNGYYGAQNYAFGSNSIYYAPEEETFEAIESELLPICSTLNSGIESQPESSCLSIGKSQIWSESNGRISIYTTTGKKVLQSSGKIDTQALTDGLYFVHYFHQGEYCSQKVWIH
jgi:CubicO group peptidase (beta-lactamase class C family)